MGPKVPDPMPVSEDADLLRAESRLIQRMSWVAAATNVLLAALKLGVGFATGSIALIGDGIHSLTDLVTDLIVLIGARLGAQPADASHPWGHGKYETLAALLVAVAIVVAGGEIAWKAAGSFLRGEIHFPGPAIIGAGLVSIVANEALYRAARRVGERTRSRALLASAWHHRSDSISSIIVILGGGLALLGVGAADSIAGVAVGILIAIVGVHFGYEALGELMEESAGEEVDRRIREVLDGELMIRGWHGLRARRVGRRIFVDLHVVVNPDMPVIDADRLAHRIEDEICRALESPCNVLVHVDPLRGECS